MASTASVPSVNPNSTVTSTQNNGLAKNTMRPSSNQKAADAGRKQSPGGSDGLSRYETAAFSAKPPCTVWIFLSFRPPLMLSLMVRSATVVLWLYATTAAN